jgi:hypothetical protein
MDSAVVSLFILFLVYAFFLNKRNNEISDFLEEVNKLCFEANIKQINAGIFLENPSFLNAWSFCQEQLPSYELLLFSCKKLKIELFLTEDMQKKFEQIENNSFLHELTKDEND